MARSLAKRLTYEEGAHHEDHAEEADSNQGDQILEGPDWFLALSISLSLSLARLGVPSTFGNSIVVRRAGVEEGPHRDTPRISGSHEPCVKVVGERTGRL